PFLTTTATGEENTYSGPKSSLADGCGFDHHGPRSGQLRYRRPLSVPDCGFWGTESSNPSRPRERLRRR
ncbi:MAG: hypothetical protein ACK58L_09590, partial [Planctomycetota bacterium]